MVFGIIFSSENINFDNQVNNKTAFIPRTSVLGLRCLSSYPPVHPSFRGGTWTLQYVKKIRRPRKVFTLMPSGSAKSRRQLNH